MENSSYRNIISWNIVELNFETSYPVVLPSKSLETDMSAEGVFGPVSLLLKFCGFYDFAVKSKKFLEVQNSIKILKFPVLA